MPGPYTTFAGEDAAGANASATNAAIASLSLVTGNNNYSATNAQITAWTSVLQSWGGKPVPQTGQLFPNRTA